VLRLFQVVIGIAAGWAGRDDSSDRAGIEAAAAWFRDSMIAELAAEG
jgi:hypothetical protein